MTVIVLLSTASLLTLLVTFVLLASRRITNLTRDQALILSGILVLELIRDVSNLLEWSGYYPIAGLFEDYPGMLEPLFWAFLFYSFIQHRVQSQLKEQEAKYRFLTESMTDVLWSATLDGQLTYISPSVCKFQGYSIAESMEQSIFELLIPSARNRAFTALADELAREGQPGNDPGRSVTMELEQFRKDGSTVWSEVCVTFIRDQAGAPVGMMGVTRDISERVAATVHQHELEAQLRQTQKLEAIGMLAGGIAHDFNNVLFGILGFCDLALDHLPDQHEATTFLKEIKLAGQRAADLVRQILSFARRTERHLAYVELTPLVKEVVRMMHSVLPAGIQVQMDLQTTSGVVYADPSEIHQVLLNLCTNAGHAIREPGGVVRLQLRQIVLPENSGQSDTGLAPGAYLALTVSDTGVGIAPEHLLQIFDPFFTTKPRGEGTGMGLSMVKSIVTELGGVITVDSKLGQGSSFTVYLPEASSQQPERAEQEQALPRGVERIIVVDDEPALATMLTLILESLGYQVAAFTQSRDALAALRADPQRYDLVITDHAMPGMTGRELASEIKKFQQDLPIIVCTGYSPTLRTQPSGSEGIAACAIKPITTRELAWLVRGVLDQAPRPAS